ncbi:hypothetical protein, partial [Lysobacter sp. N42]|uniref:hypothetical protein n=1 Tax=Lysobacter sp. N42 TaxID=2545719 RepID=UPI001044682F
MPERMARGLAPALVAAGLVLVILGWLPAPWGAAAALLAQPLLAVGLALRAQALAEIGHYHEAYGMLAALR